MRFRSRRARTPRRRCASLARRLRSAHADAYAALADRVESELGLTAAAIPAEALGSIDTFRFEERALLAHCARLIATGKHREALQLVTEREQSFWLDRDVGRKAQWEAVRRMAELGSVVAEVRYRGRQGRRRAARLDRRLRVRRTAGTASTRPSAASRAGSPSSTRSPTSVRSAWSGAPTRTPATRMAEGFAQALAKAGWTVPGALHQTHVYSDIVAARPKPVAYFLVDAMRFEMGVELARAPAEDVRGRPDGQPSAHCPASRRSAWRPSSLALRRASRSSSRRASSAARIDEAFLPDLAARQEVRGRAEPRSWSISRSTSS